MPTQWPNPTSARRLSSATPPWGSNRSRGDLAAPLSSGASSITSVLLRLSAAVGSGYRFGNLGSVGCPLELFQHVPRGQGDVRGPNLVPNGGCVVVVTPERRETPAGALPTMNSEEPDGVGDAALVDGVGVSVHRARAAPHQHTARRTGSPSQARHRPCRREPQRCSRRRVRTAQGSRHLIEDHRERGPVEPVEGHIVLSRLQIPPSTAGVRCSSVDADA